MKNTLWKLTALAGVVGIVLLAFLQAQHGLNSGGDEDFVPADAAQFGEAQPDLGEAAGGDAPPFEAAGTGLAMVDDPAPEADRSAGDELDLGNEFDAGDWDAELPTTDPDPQPGRDTPTPIRRRRDAGVRTADAVEPERDRQPAILPVGGEEPQPVPRPDEFDPDAAFGAETFPAERMRTKPVRESKDDEFDDGGFGPDLFTEDPDTKSADESRTGGPGTGGPRIDAPSPTRFGAPATFDDPPALDAPKRTADREEFPGFDDGPSLGGPAAPETETGPAPQPFKRAPAEEAGDGFDGFPPLDDERPATKTDEAPKLEPFPEFDDGPLPGRTESPEAPAPSGPEPFDPDAFDTEPGDDTPKPTETEPGGSEPTPPPVEPFKPEGPSLGGTAPLTEPRPLGDGPGETTPLETSPAGPEPERVNPPTDAEPLGPDDLVGNATLGATAPVQPQRPKLTIEKVAPENALLGQPMVYSIIVKNTGDTPAQQVVVHDRIPKGTKLTGTIPRAELLDRGDGNAEKSLRWKLGTIKAGETKKIAIRVTPFAEGQIGSVATVNFVAEVAARTKVTSPTLEFSLTGPKRARLGKPVIFQFDVKNGGTGVAKGVLIRNLIPAGLKHPGGDDLEYSVGDLAPGESKSVRLSVTAIQEGELVNRAIATAEGGVKVESNARVTIMGTDLAVSRTGPAKRYAGRTAVFTNVVANNGAVPLENVTVVEALPKGIEFVEAAAGGQYDPARHRIAWRIDRLGPKESRVLKVKLKPKSPGRFTCTITAESETGQKASTSGETQAVGYTALSLDVEGGGPPVFVGDSVTFTITPLNRGTTNASDVEVVVAVSPELELDSVNAPTKYTRTGNTIRFAAMPTLGAGASAGYELKFRAVKPGEGRIGTTINAADLSRPLQRDEAVRVVAETP